MLNMAIIVHCSVCNTHKQKRKVRLNMAIIVHCSVCNTHKQNRKVRLNMAIKCTVLCAILTNRIGMSG